MFDPDLAEEMFEPNQIEALAGAFMTILNSGLIEAQIVRERARLTAGYLEEDDEELNKRIREYRGREQSLLTFAQFCESMKEYVQ